MLLARILERKGHTQLQLDLCFSGHWLEYKKKTSLVSNNNTRKSEDVNPLNILSITYNAAINWNDSIS